MFFVRHVLNNPIKDGSPGFWSELTFTRFQVKGTLKRLYFVLSFLSF